MYNRIYSFLCKHKLINNKQFGFRSKHSTEHALISLIETIKKHLDDGELVCGVFVDLQKAFDTVNHKILPENLKHYGIRNRMIGLDPFIPTGKTTCLLRVSFLRQT